MINRYKATAKIVLAHSSRKSKIDGRRPVQLRIIYNRRPKYYKLPYAVHEEDFVRIFNGQARGDLHDLRIRLLDIENKSSYHYGKKFTGCNTREHFHIKKIKTYAAKLEQE